jgi:hypothetical protein
VKKSGQREKDKTQKKQLRSVTRLFVIVKYLKQKKNVQIKKIELNRVWPKMFVTLFRPSFCPAAKICNKIKFSFIGSPFGSTSFQLFAP